MDANYSNGSSIYHGFTANLRKRFNQHYEFLASYTWSHAIDDSTDLQATLTPQDSFYPGLDRSTSLFDQRHRFVFSGVFQTGKVGSGFARHSLQRLDCRSFARYRFGTSFQHHHRQRRQSSALVADRPAQHHRQSICRPAATRPSLRNIRRRECCRSHAFNGFGATLTTPTLLQLDGNLGRNAGIHALDASSTTCAISKRIYIGERFSTESHRRHVQYRQ